MAKHYNTNSYLVNKNCLWTRTKFIEVLTLMTGANVFYFVFVFRQPACCHTRVLCSHTQPAVSQERAGGLLPEGVGLEGGEAHEEKVLLLVVHHKSLQQQISKVSFFIILNSKKYCNTVTREINHVVKLQNRFFFMIQF